MPGLAFFAPGKPQAVYFTNSGSPQAPTSATLKRYNVQTKATETIISLPATWIYDAQLSRDGLWILLNASVQNRSALQLVRIDGQHLQTLYCTPAGANVQSLPFAGTTSTQWSPDQQYITFVSGLDQGTPSVFLLTLKSGRLDTLLQGSSSSEVAYLPRTWQDDTHIILTSMHPHSDAPPADLYLLDIKNGTEQSEQKLQRILTTNELCWDFDSSSDASQLFVNHCQQQGSAPGSGRIDLFSPIGSNHPKTIFSSTQLAISHIRTITYGKTDALLFSAYNTIVGVSTEHSQDGLWLVRTDGSQLRRLTSYPYINLNAFGQYPWSNVSRDGQYYAVAPNSSPAGRSVMVGSLNGGPLTQVAIQSSDIAEVFLVGWTAM
ncbi:hypothetical protein KSF_077760 [Reticulibacter mediterranei]|uniref:Uncharacterized protein n=2 Tax=Reticulibacter mediterranei TaxID=2778369 RepID=A0A8J3IPD2_9CHLR|nr:hypothetical protein KSF_077760 [Reticulibacter mediterranei]